MSVSKIILVGHLGRDPELRETTQGQVCEFTLATNDRRRDPSGETQDVTTWYKISVWGSQAENCSRYLSKGRLVYVEGRLFVEDWTDKEGRSRYTLHVRANEVEFLNGSPSSTEGETIHTKS